MIFCSTTEPSYDFPPRKYRRVLTGLEQFARNGAIKYKGKHAALVANHSSVTADFRHLIDVARSNDIIIDFVLSPEHGPFGERNNYDNHVYEIFEGKNLIVYHLHHFTSTSLKTLLEIPEIIIFDIQDMSMRCYTYVSSLKLIIDALDGTNTNLIVLDRPNPLGFLGVSGPYLDNKFFSPQVASFPATLFYEMTLGEAARYYCNEFRKNINLTVIPLANYTRDIFFHETKLPWIPPSPNLPTYRSAINYSVLVLMEGINISLGRGTSNPFEFFGAPWIDPDELCLHLSSLKIQNFKFRPVYFRPTISPYIGNLCGGAHMYYIGGIFEPLEISYAIIKMFREKYTHVTWRKNQRGFIIDELCGTDSFRKAIDSGKTYPEYKKLIEKEILNFHAKRKKYLLY
ncbi:MAG: DUF1343 domain-containing protein [Spirochaetes bacterium]|nr:DUF1343 domain-containing protein [Spirochaetota bacterium]